jgi:hypothetical protein
MLRHRQQRYDHRLDPALRSAIVRAAGKHGGHIGGPARARRMTPLERSIAAMRAVRARWERTTAEERRAWSDYMRAHQRRFLDGKTLPRKPAPVHAPEPVSSAPSTVRPIAPPTPARSPCLMIPAPPIPTVVIPRPFQTSPLAEPRKVCPGLRFDV